jgi:hypothetical protein
VQPHVFAHQCKAEAGAFARPSFACACAARESFEDTFSVGLRNPFARIFDADPYV